MQTIAKIIVWGAALILGVVVGLRWLFDPVGAGNEFGIAYNGAVGLNQVRGDMGGVFVGLGVITILGVTRPEPRFLEAVAIAIGGVIVGRAWGVIVDGFAPLSVVSMGIEVVLLASLVITANGMGDAAGQESSSDS